MKSKIAGFNIYLASVAVFWAAGCGTYREKHEFSKKEQSTIRFYLEGNPTDTLGTGTILVTRQRVPMTIEREPFLTEGDLRKAVMLDDPGPNGGYSIELAFKEHGALMLDMVTTANKGRHIVIFSQFPHPGYKPPKEKTKKSKAQEEEQEDSFTVPLPSPPPEEELPGHPRTSAWLAAVKIRSRDPSGIFRFSPDASREEGARIVRGLKNVIAYEKALDKD